jgi:hypothetical protein
MLSMHLGSQAQSLAPRPAHNMLQVFQASRRSPRTRRPASSPKEEQESPPMSLSELMAFESDLSPRDAARQDDGRAEVSNSCAVNN